MKTASLRDTLPLEVTQSPRQEPIPNYKPDLFAFKGQVQNPHISEYTYSFATPAEYQGRILNHSLVHTAGNTSQAMITHHTEERPKLAPGTIRSGMLTTSCYRASQDPALQEVAEVAQVVAPHVDALVAACSSYHGFREDGWITTAGFMTCAKKAGLTLSRGEFLALERSVRKDTLGRINYQEVADLVLSWSQPQAQA